MAKLDPEILMHLEWLGFVRPTGLVVSAPALVRAGAILNRRDSEGQELLRTCTAERTFDPAVGPVPCLTDFRQFAQSVLEWTFSPKGYAGTAESPVPPELEVSLPEYGETLRPDFAVHEPEPRDGVSPWQLLVTVLEPGTDPDRVTRSGGQLEASAHGRMERLLRQTGVPAGLLCNGQTLRLVSAPRGESSGWIDFRVGDMLQTAGRPISTAMRLLLSEFCLLTQPRSKRLAALLEDSRKFQNEVSERLAQQVLHALYELLRGFQSAHDASKGELLREVLAEHPDEVYRSLLTVILRLVFLLYAEERDMLPGDETFLRYYSLAGLHKRLREDAALFPDTMDQRYGAWAQLLVLFRMIHDGAETSSVRLPRRYGVLFDPDRYKFLEGRPIGGARQTHERITPPLVPDGTIYRALAKLLVLDGERISYRALDVEQIGSVYETMMGFRLETATGLSVAIRSQKKHGAPMAVNLEELLAVPAAKREKWLLDHSGRKLSAGVQRSAAQAKSLEELHSALLPVIDGDATPDLVPKGAMVLQPSEERRRSGSHYTPRSLTEPIVRTTLEPILTRLRGENGRPPKPEQILDLKVCDPAMGSGAFLVEACRQLGDALVEAWHAHGEVPPIPSDEDEIVLARRLIAQRCLYGVDRNPVAVDLAKVSLWLVTLAKDHALTFVDHALRHGDSLVGLTEKQIENFHWDISVTWNSPFRARMREQLKAVAKLRERIRSADENVADWELHDLWDETQFELGKVRLLGDLVLAAYFEGDNLAAREGKRGEYAAAAIRGETNRYVSWLEEWRYAELPLVPFHWEVEFPEVFDRRNPGFDAIVGNPPFLKGSKISGTQSKGYLNWILLKFLDSGGQADIVAYFFQQSYLLLRMDCCFGLLATQTIAQGSTKKCSLEWIVRNNGTIFHAVRRIKWIGIASVTVSRIHVCKSTTVPVVSLLDGCVVDRITAFLMKGGSDYPPMPLISNRGIAFMGFYPYGEGFTFDDNVRAATPLSEMHRIMNAYPEEAAAISPYLGGDEFLEHPQQLHRRFVIWFREMTEDEARTRFPTLMHIVEEKVRKDRLENSNKALREEWWLFGRRRPALQHAITGRDRILMHSYLSKHVAYAFVPARTLVASPHYAFALSSFAAFASLQNRVHETWVRFFASTLGDTLTYTANIFFEPYPFSKAWQDDINLEMLGQSYYDYRASLMLRYQIGLTEIYNRFHDPSEVSPEIVKLRELHSSMDCAVLNAYGWSDIQTECKFLLDFAIDEEEWGNKKKPYRYRWPDEVRDEVLARLLELNAQRAKEDALTGAAGGTKKGTQRAGTTQPKNMGDEMRDLFL